MPEPRKSPILPLAIAALAAIALLAALSGMPGNSTSTDDERSSAPADIQQQPTPPDDPLAQLVRREKGDPMAKGELDAPVVLVAYSEFRCPFCGKFARDTAPVLEKKYVEAGTLRIEWRHFPYLGPESTTAALAGRAAAAQGKVWDFHDEMYADQLPPNSGNLDKKYVEGVAQRIGLDIEKFLIDLKSARTQKLVARDFQEGQSIGVSGTPSFLINGRPVVGAQPTEVFEQVIEEAAAAS